MLGIIVAIFFVLHGLIHLFGFVVPWKILKTDDFPYSTTILAGKVDLGPIGIRLVGFLWLLAAVSFVIAGVGLYLVTPWWLPVTVGATLFSLVMCISGWPDSQFGVYINLFILAFLYFGDQFRWLP